MSLTVRLSLTLLIMLAFTAVASFQFGNSIVMLSTAGVGAFLLIIVWVIKPKGAEFGGTPKRPANLDYATKKLIGIIKKKFNEDEIGEIGDSAQDIIIASVKAVNTKKMKTLSQAVDDLVTVVPARMQLEGNRIILGATLASYYLQAEDKGEDGDDTRMRIDNFIAGIDDRDL
ncbi:MAG: hypothetical protein O3A84_00590 [Proteobacteria bacterium]|nr:hypothetical protein [Pseudomonadota bacterium]